MKKCYTCKSWMCAVPLIDLNVDVDKVVGTCNNNFGKDKVLGGDCCQYWERYISSYTHT